MVVEPLDHSPVHMPFQGDFGPGRLQFVLVQDLQEHAHVSIIDASGWRASAMKTAVDEPGDTGPFVAPAEFLKVFQSQWRSSSFEFEALVALALPK